MSGHSKWSQIKRQKGVADIKRGALFTKLAREIIVAAKQGGGDPDGNFRLRLAVQKARENNMPMDNIERAIRKGTGAEGGGEMDEVMYEGYGPGGTAILVSALTDNRNRTVSDVRAAFSRGGGRMAEAGSVACQFDNRGVITIDGPKADPDELALLAIDAGAEDFQVEDGTIEIVTAPTDLERVKKALEDQSVAVASAELAMVPKQTVPLSDDDASQTLRLLDRIEDLDDVQRVYTNADFPDAVLAAFSG